jgi:small subunit ribosomal protein S20
MAQIKPLSNYLKVGTMAEEKKGKERRPKALKRDLQSEKRRLQNRGEKSRIKSAVRAFDESRLKKDESSTAALLNTVYSLLDKSVKKGVFKQNKADRTKSRLAARALAAV